MNSTVMNTIKALVEHKKYSAITEYANVLHGKNNLIVSEYGGANVRLYKDDDKVHLLCPTKIDTVQEGYLANAIANGTVFDDADEIDRNAEVIERTTIPYDAMLNSGKEPPRNLKPMISIVIGRMSDDGGFDVTDADRTNGINFVKDATAANANGERVNGVVDNYLEKEDNGYYTPEIGKNISGLNNELGEVNDTDPGDVVSDDDTVDSYDDYDMNEIERDPDADTTEDHDEPDEAPEEEPMEEGESDDNDNDVDDSDDDVPEDNEEVTDDPIEEPVEECGENCNSNNKPIVQEDGEEDDAVDAVDDSGGAEQMGEDIGETEAIEEGNPVTNAIKIQKAKNDIKNGEVGKAFLRKTENSKNQWSIDDLSAAADEIDRRRAEASTAKIEEAATIDQNIKAPTEETTPGGSVNKTAMPMSASTKDRLNTIVHQEGFLSKKPKKLKPIGRDVVAYITCEMNDIHSANDQAMLAGYTCSKIELVDWYITVLDTQDPKYIVPHTRQYLVTIKAQLESLLSQILKIRPINRSEQIWRVNYPSYNA